MGLVETVRDMISGGNVSAGPDIGQGGFIEFTQPDLIAVNIGVIVNRSGNDNLRTGQSQGISRAVRAAVIRRRGGKDAACRGKFQYGYLAVYASGNIGGNGIGRDIINRAAAAGGIRTYPGHGSGQVVLNDRYLGRTVPVHQAKGVNIAGPVKSRAAAVVVTRARAGTGPDHSPRRGNLFHIHLRVGTGRIKSSGHINITGGVPRYIILQAPIIVLPGVRRRNKVNGRAARQRLGCYVQGLGAGLGQA